MRAHSEGDGDRDDEPLNRTADDGNLLKPRLVSTGITPGFAPRGGARRSGADVRSRDIRRIKHFAVGYDMAMPVTDNASHQFPPRVIALDVFTTL